MLAPHAADALGLVPTALAMFVGAIVLLLTDRALERRGDRLGAVLAGVVDIVPQALALGAVAATGGGTLPLLAAVFALQNLPEGFEAYHALRHARHGSRFAAGAVAALGLLPPLAALAGYVLLGGSGGGLALIAGAAAGGVLYLVFQDVAPMAHREGSHGATLASVLGFVLVLAFERLYGV